MSTKGHVQAERVYPSAAQSGGSTSPGQAAFSTSLFIDSTTPTTERCPEADLQNRNVNNVAHDAVVAALAFLSVETLSACILDDDNDVAIITTWTHNY